MFSCDPNLAENVIPDASQPIAYAFGASPTGQFVPSFIE
jgi:hypothetical protein